MGGLSVWLQKLLKTRISAAGVGGETELGAKSSEAKGEEANSAAQGLAHGMESI